MLLAALPSNCKASQCKQKLAASVDVRMKVSVSLYLLTFVSHFANVS